MSDRTDHSDDNDDELVDHDDSPPGQMPFFQEIPPRHAKGSRRFILMGLLLAISIPIVLGLVFVLLRSLVSPGN